jgi:hypothetical protein
MTPYPYHIVVNGDGRRTLSIFIPHERPIIVDGDHPQYDRLLFEAEQGELDYDSLVRYVLHANAEEEEDKAERNREYLEIMKKIPAGRTSTYP